MKATPESNPENIVPADPVMEQFVSVDKEKMRIPRTVRSIPRFMLRLFTKIEQIMFNKKPRLKQ